MTDLIDQASYAEYCMAKECEGYLDLAKEVPMAARFNTEAIAAAISHLEQAKALVELARQKRAA